MIWNRHFNLEGKHALLGASKFYWVNDEDVQFEQRVFSSYAAEIGTHLHAIARKYIQHGFRMNKFDKKNVLLELIDRDIPGRVIDELNFDAMYTNLMAYTNDCVTYHMTPEVLLYFSDNCFGTADAIGFYGDEMILRIHDLKNGITKAHIEQLMIYAALFCWEYHVKPESLQDTDLRIYQTNEVLVHHPTPAEIRFYMERINERDRHLNDIQGKGDYSP